MPIVLGPAPPSLFPSVLSFWGVATDIASSTDDLPGLAALHARDPDALLIASDDGTIVGSLIVGWDGWRGSFSRLAVLPGHRGRGIGRMLVAEGEARLRRLGARRVSLFAVVAHKSAMSFWRAVGYEPDPGELRFVRTLAPEPEG